MPETPEPHLRRQPQQARGQQRIQKILDAAEHIFADVGYDNATTNAIAVRAETSIGSLYQFFPHKEAILKALVLRYLEEMRTLFDQHLTPESLATLSLPLFLERPHPRHCSTARISPGLSTNLLCHADLP